MSKCPFWSTKKERVNCYDGCPMTSCGLDGEGCPFKEVLDKPKIAYKDIANDNFAYPQEQNIEYDFLKQISNY